MKTSSLFILLLLVFTITSAQPLEEWVARYDNTGNTDVFLDMAHDAAGNTYVCGYSDSPITGTDIIVAKYALDGTELWVYNYEGAGEDKAVALALTNTNDVVVTGHSEQGGTAKDMITILVNGSTGQIMSGWPQFMDGPANGDDWANDVAVRQSDNLIAVCGAYTDSYLRKGLITYETNGNTNWVGNQWNSSNYDSYNMFCDFYSNGRLIVVDQFQTSTLANVNSNIYVLNGTTGGFLSSANGAELGSNNIARDLCVQGTKAYIATDSYHGNTSLDDYMMIFEVDGSNPPYSIIGPPLVSVAYGEYDGVSTALTVNSSTIFVSGYEDVNPLSSVQLDGYIAAFDRNSGSQSYWTNYGGNESDSFNDIAIDNLSNANAYVTGFTSVGGNRNIVTAKFTAAGLLDWDVQHNGTGNSTDEAYRIGVGSGATSGSIWVCGKSVGQGTGDDAIAIKYCTPPVAIAGTDKEFCTGGSAQLGGSSTTGYTYLWTPTTGLSSSTVSNPTVSLTNTSNCPIVHEYVLKVTNANGCSNYDTVQVEVFHAPTVSIVTSQPNVICENESPIVITPTVGIGCEGTPSYAWKKGTTTVSTSPNPYSVGQVSQTGSYTFIVTNNYGATSCATTSNAVSATVNPVPVGSANPSTSAICIGDATSIQLGSSQNGTAYTWIANGGGSTSGSGNTIGQTLNTVGTATYTITPTVTSTGCVGNSFSATVTVNPLPTAPTVSASGSTEFCDGGSVTLSSTVASSYSWLPNGETSSSINVDATGAYSVTITDANGCENSSTPLQVTVNPNPVADAGTDLTFCEGFSQFIGGSPTASGGQGGYLYTWNNGASLDDATSSNPTLLTSLASGNYSFTVTVTDQNGCEDTDQVLVSIVSTLVADAGQDETICYGDTVQLNGTGGNVYMWWPTSGLAASNISDPLASPTDTTEYRLIVSASGCDNDTAWVTVNVNPLPPQPTLTVSGLDITCNESGYSYQWSLNGNELGETGQTIYNANQTGDYSVTIADENGCENTSISVMPVGIDDQEAFSLTVFPNPSNGQFELVLPILLDNGGYQVYDNIGHLVKHGSITSERTHIDMSGFAEGVYMLRLLDGGESLGVERVALINP
ncbi:MAG: T9SS type A sorting domain-containing protein [Flavobacteriales bacterium]|nr:T9SS type A sorting domain-containing protein [Flavobacteriales bacterium]